MRKRRGWIIKEHVWKTHGQSQRGLGLRVGGGDGWGWGGVVWGKWRQLYLNNNKKNKCYVKNKIKHFLNVKKKKKMRPLGWALIRGRKSGQWHTRENTTWQQRHTRKDSQLPDPPTMATSHFQAPNCVPVTCWCIKSNPKFSDVDNHFSILVEVRCTPESSNLWNPCRTWFFRTIFTCSHKVTGCPYQRQTTGLEGPVVSLVWNFFLAVAYIHTSIFFSSLTKENLMISKKN